MKWDCSYKIARNKYKSLECHKLEFLYKHLFGNKIQTHRAEDDVDMGIKIYKEMTRGPFGNSNSLNKLYFDVETTGLSQDDEIVEISFKIFNENEIKFNYTKCINIHKKYNVNGINNITQEDIDNGDELIDVLYIFMRKIKEYKVKNIIAHNLSFDKNMLINNIKREYEKDKKNNKIINIINVLGFHDIINNNNIQRTINFGVK